MLGHGFSPLWSRCFAALDDGVLGNVTNGTVIV
jgi:hypothetical protein